MVQVQDVPGLVERLLGFLDIGKDFVTAETIVQVRAPDMGNQVCCEMSSSWSIQAFLWLCR